MTEETTTAAIVAGITGIVSAAAFKFYEFFLRQKREIQKEEKNEQAMYREDLIRRVERLESDKDTRIEEVIIFRSDISALQVKVEYLQTENNRLSGRVQVLAQENTILKTLVTNK